MGGDADGILVRIGGSRTAVGPGMDGDGGLGVGKAARASASMAVTTVFCVGSSACAGFRYASTGSRSPVVMLSTALPGKCVCPCKGEEEEEQGEVAERKRLAARENACRSRQQGSVTATTRTVRKLPWVVRPHLCSVSPIHSDTTGSDLSQQAWRKLPYSER